MGFPAKVLALPHETIWSGSSIDGFWQRALFQTEQAVAMIRDLIQAGTAWEEMERILFERYYPVNLLIYTLYSREHQDWREPPYQESTGVFVIGDLCQRFLRLDNRV